MVQPSVSEDKRQTVDTFPLQLIHWLRTLSALCSFSFHGAVPLRIAIPDVWVFPLRHSCISVTSLLWDRDVP